MAARIKKVTEGCLIQFRYENWKGNTHEYVIQVESFELSEEFPEPTWVLHGTTITRDGDPRPEMGPTRRRTFELNKMKELYVL